jgi:16S rRNA (guanine527-N7)-methyltransferase
MSNKDYSFMKNVPRGTIESLSKYIALLKKWNDKINLISKNDLENIWFRHVYDSLQLLNFIEDKNITILDIGSGAGFPGLVLSIAGVQKTFLVESNSKKANFLQTASQYSKSSVNILNSRIENAESKNNDIITTRGFSSLYNLLSIPNLQFKDRILLIKGEKIFDEIEQCQYHGMKLEYNLHSSELSMTNYIVEIFSWKI